MRNNRKDRTVGWAIAAIASAFALAFVEDVAAREVAPGVSVEPLIEFIATRDPALLRQACINDSNACWNPPISFKKLADEIGGFTVWPIEGRKLEIYVSLDLLPDGTAQSRAVLATVLVHELTHYYQVLARRYYKGVPPNVCGIMGMEIDAYRMGEEYLDVEGYHWTYKVHPIVEYVNQCRLSMR